MKLCKLCQQERIKTILYSPIALINFFPGFPRKFCELFALRCYYPIAYTSPLRVLNLSSNGAISCSAHDLEYKCLIVASKLPRISEELEEQGVNVSRG